jgi:hypothetical protein
MHRISGDATEAYAINDQGLIAGYTTNAQNHSRGYIFAP